MCKSWPGRKAVEVCKAIVRLLTTRQATAQQGMVRTLRVVKVPSVYSWNTALMRLPPICKGEVAGLQLGQRILVQRLSPSAALIRHCGHIIPLHFVRGNVIFDNIACTTVQQLLSALTSSPMVHATRALTPQVV